MKRTLFLLPVLVLALSLGGCLKSNIKITVNNDATAALEMTNQMNGEAIDNMLDMVLGMIEMQGGDEVNVDEIEEGIGEMRQMFDPKKSEAEMKKAGIEVESVTAIDKDGWKGYTVKGKIKDINKAVEKMAKASEKEASENPFAEAMPNGPAGFAPKFYKTDDPKVGKVVLIPSLDDIFAKMGQNPMEALDDIPEEARDQAEGMIENFKSMFLGNDINFTVEIVLPGELVTVVGAKKTGAKSFRMAIKGTDLTMDNAANLFGLRKGVMATFKIPEGCKLTFVDPNAAKKPKAEKKEDGEKKKDEKKGGLKIGG